MAANGITNMPLALLFKKIPSFGPLSSGNDCPGFFASPLNKALSKRVHTPHCLQLPFSYLLLNPLHQAFFFFLSRSLMAMELLNAMAFTNGSDQWAAFDRREPSFLLDVIFFFASGQHASLVSSCLYGCSFSISVADVPDI